MSGPLTLYTQTFYQGFAPWTVLATALLGAYFSPLLDPTQGCLRHCVQIINSVLYRTSVSNLHKLQMVQNALARTITRSPRSVPTSQLLSNLHWLPIHKRINFKVAILTYKVLSTQQPQPAYLYNLISYHQASRSLRSSSQSLLQVPRVKTDFGRRAFSSAAPQIWNHIPAAIKVSPSLDSFKRHLKTHYFTSP